MIRTFSSPKFLPLPRNRNIHFRECIMNEDFYRIFLSLKDLPDCGGDWRIIQLSTKSPSTPPQVACAPQVIRVLSMAHICLRSQSRDHHIELSQFSYFSLSNLSLEFQPIKRHRFGKKLRSHHFGAFAREFLFYTFLFPRRDYVIVTNIRLKRHERREFILP